MSLPLIGIAYSQASGALFGSNAVTFVIGIIAWLLAFVSLRRGMAALTRGRLLHV